MLDPIVSRTREEGLKASKIHAEDTPVLVLEPGPIPRESSPTSPASFRPTPGQNHELLAAEARDNVLGAAGIAQPCCKFLQDHIAMRVAETVVDLLEVVDVEDHQRVQPPPAIRPGENAVEPGDEGAAVGDAGQLVGLSQLYNLQWIPRRISISNFTNCLHHDYIGFALQRA